MPLKGLAMTEEEWLACNDPAPMLRFLTDKGSDRKLRLFGVACCRRIWDAMWEGCHPGVEVVEQFAEGLIGPEVLRLPAVRRLARSVGMRNPVAATAAINAAEWVRGGDAYELDPTSPWQQEEAGLQAQLLRDIFGDPFRPVTLHPSWLTHTITSLAQAIYDNRQLPSGLFDNLRMGILADALEEAGCDNADVLGHLRSGGDHIRGCWPVDIILGRS
jgi:hypothetical protein